MRESGDGCTTSTMLWTISGRFRNEEGNGSVGQEVHIYIYNNDDLFVKASVRFTHHFLSLRTPSPGSQIFVSKSHNKSIFVLWDIWKRKDLKNNAFFLWPLFIKKSFWTVCLHSNHYFSGLVIQVNVNLFLFRFPPLSSFFSSILIYDRCSRNHGMVKATPRHTYSCLSN